MNIEPIEPDSPAEVAQAPNAVLEGASKTGTPMAPMRLVEIWIDGACSGNPGPGGWAALLRNDRGEERERSGSERPTTNIRMEMLAAIKALEWLKNPRRVRLHTDSDLVVKG